MARTADLERVREQNARAAQLVEVPCRARSTRNSIFPAAISLPLKELDAAAADRRCSGQLPVVVYCWDALGDMSPRAAAWLDSWASTHTTMQLGKVDWVAHGLPTEGSEAGAPSALSLVRGGVVTCGLDEDVAGIGNGAIACETMRVRPRLAGAASCSGEYGDRG